MSVRVHVVDGTYELFRQHFGRPGRLTADGVEVGATLGVLRSLLGLVAEGATHIGVATDHVIESFRNSMWEGYKNGLGIPEDLSEQFPILEEGLAAMGFMVWPMEELEADDGLASATAISRRDPRVEQVVICTPDKDLAQCVQGTTVVMLDRRRELVIDEDGVREKYGVSPESIPDFLGLVGDSADGFPGLAGWGQRSASAVLSHYHHLESIPDDVEEWDARLRKSLRGAAGLAQKLTEERRHAELFRDLATLRSDAELFGSVDELRWQGPTPAFAEVCRILGDSRLNGRAEALAAESA